MSALRAGEDIGMVKGRWRLDIGRRRRREGVGSQGSVGRGAGEVGETREGTGDTGWHREVGEVLGRTEEEKERLGRRERGPEAHERTGDAREVWGGPGTDV